MRNLLLGHHVKFHMLDWEFCFCYRPEWVRTSFQESKRQLDTPDKNLCLDLFFVFKAFPLVKAGTPCWKEAENNKGRVRERQELVRNNTKYSLIKRIFYLEAKLNTPSSLPHQTHCLNNLSQELERKAMKKDEVGGKMLVCIHALKQLLDLDT